MQPMEQAYERSLPRLTGRFVGHQGLLDLTHARRRQLLDKDGHMSLLHSATRHRTQYEPWSPTSGPIANEATKNFFRLDRGCRYAAR